MKRSRSGDDQQDSLDLLLDTVSNVFGGVMFLTLLAALLILSRGTNATEQEPDLDLDPPPKLSTVLLDAETRRTAAALAVQKKLQQRLDADGKLSEKVERLRSLESTLTLARRHARRSDRKFESQQQAMQDQLAAESDLEAQIVELTQEIERQQGRSAQIRSQSERSVQFRPLSRSQSLEAVVLLRYGRWYLLQTGTDAESLNREDFFILNDAGGVTRMTPKPHRGNPVDDRSLQELVAFLSKVFPSRSFHVVIAVWDDSFAEFNPLKDAIISAGYQYRTLPCDSSSRLSNQYAAEAYVQ